MEPISLLTTLNQNYIPQLRVLLTSLRSNNPGEAFTLYLLHSGIPASALDALRRQCVAYGYTLEAVMVDNSLFEEAPITRQYPKEMYYRLLAAHLLPSHVRRVLYLDPDVLVINPIRPLWEMDLQGNLFAAAAHTGKTDLSKNVNQLRLGTEHDYYNSGVLLMDLEQARQVIQPSAVFEYVQQHRKELFLPDQDVLNALYGSRILPLEDVLWNYDARHYSNYLLRSGGQWDMPWVMQHTAILHFCGKAKPWKPGYRHRFGVLYLHYARMTERNHVPD